MPLLTRAAAAAKGNAPIYVGDTNRKSAPKRQKKAVKNKGKKAAALPAGSRNASAPSTPPPTQNIFLPPSPSTSDAEEDAQLNDNASHSNDEDPTVPHDPGISFPSSSTESDNYGTPRASPANSCIQKPNSQSSTPSGNYSRQREDEEQEVPASPPRFTATQKRKEKEFRSHHSQNQTYDEDGADNLSDQSSNEQQQFRAGPIRAAAKSQVIEARRIYHETVAAIAHEENKSVDLLFSIVGQNRVKPRRVNVWNAFQSWYPEHGEIKREDYMSSIEYNNIIRDEYNRMLEDLGNEVDDPVARKLHFNVQLEWYESKMQDFIYSKKNDGKFDAVVSNIVDKFNHLGLIAWEQYGIHCFGYIIDPNRDLRGRTSSIAWGSGPLYKELRNTYDSTIMKQLNDYEGMFKGLEALKAGKEYAQNRYSVDLRHIHGEGERDRSRRLFGEFLRVDILRIIHEQVHPGDAKKIQMAWARWPEMAFRYKIRLVGWPAEIGKVPGPGFNYKVDIKPKILAKLVSARIQALSREDEDNDGIMEEDPLCQIEQWMDEEKELPDEQLMSVPLVLDDSEPAITLMTLLESKKFKQQVRKRTNEHRDGRNYQLFSEYSENNETAQAHLRLPYARHAPQTYLSNIDETHHQNSSLPYTQGLHQLHATAPETSNINEVLRPRPHRHPDAAQRNKHRLGNASPTRHQQGYHEEAYNDGRYTSLQAPLQAQHQHHAGTYTQNDRYQESSNENDEDEEQGSYLRQDILKNTGAPHHKLPPLQGLMVTRHSNSSRAYRQPLPHRLVESQLNRINQAHHLKTTREHESSMEPPSKKRKIHDIDNGTRQVLPMPRRAGNQIAGSSHSRIPLPQSSEAGPSQHRQQVFDNQLDDIHDNHEDYNLYNDAAYYN